MKIPFVDLKRQFRELEPEIRRRIDDVLEHGQFIMGPEVFELEKRLAEWVGVHHAVACSSGTDALLLALMALGVGPGDAVYTTPFTFIATAEVIRLVGATPVFVDIDPRTFNLDPRRLHQILNGGGMGPSAAASGPQGRLRPKAIIAVDLFGLPADYDRINALAREHGLLVIEDAAQSFGASRGGRNAGALALVAATSFFPAKPLGGYGDGGAVFTDEPDLFRAVRSASLHGQGEDKYVHERIGLNARLDTLQAAVLLAKMDAFGAEVERRREIAARYHHHFRQAAPALLAPEVPPDARSAWAQYTLLSPHRGAIRSALQHAGIPTAVYYPLPLHLQNAFVDLGYGKGDFPVAEQCSQQVFSLPIHPYLEDDQVDTIAEVVLKSVATLR